MAFLLQHGMILGSCSEVTPSFYCDQKEKIHQVLKFKNNETSTHAHHHSRQKYVLQLSLVREFFVISELLFLKGRDFPVWHFFSNSSTLTSS